MSMRFLSLLSIVELLLPQLAIAKVEQVSVCWEEALKPPYLMLDGTKPVGIMVELLDEVLKKKGITPMPVVYPWKRCLIDVEKGSIDLVPNSSFKDERALYAEYTKPFYKTHMMLFYLAANHKEPPRISTLEELSKFTLGGIKDFNYDFLEKKVPLDTKAVDRPSLIHMLRGGRFPFAIEQKEVVLNLVKEKKVDFNGVAMIPSPVSAQKEFHILVSKKHKEARELAKMLNEGLAEITADGTADRIYKKYLDGI